MAKKLNFGQMGMAMEAAYGQKLQDQRNKDKEENYSNSGYMNEMATFNENNKIKQSLFGFKSEVRQALMIEAVYCIYNAAFGNKIEYENEAVIKRGLVAKFVNEQGAENLFNSFKGKTLLLSEYYTLVDKYTNYIVEANKETKTNSIDQEIKDKFFDELFTDETKDVALSIKMRVASAISEFNYKNQEEKMDLENVIKLSQEKIASAKTEELKEQYQIDANRSMFKIRQRKRNIFESMVYNMDKSYYKNKAIQEQYSTDGKIDIDKIIESCEIMYTFLETLNTSKMVTMDEDYLQAFIKDFTV